MTLQTSNALPSNLARVLRQVKDAFGAIGNPTPVMVGTHYLVANGVGGSDERIVFVPEPRESPGAVTDASETGYAAGFLHSCNVHVRAPEGGSMLDADVDRYERLYDLLDLAIDCIRTAAPGRIVFGRVVEESPLDVDGPGVGLVMSFQYFRNVEHNTARWTLASATADASAERPLVPPGSPGTVDSVSLIVTPPS